MTQNMIPASEFCESHSIEISFIHDLEESGLIEIETIDEAGYLYEHQLPELERIVRLHYDLDINLEGIETITHLLHRMNDLQEEITTLKNRLRFFEGHPFP